MRGFFEGEVVVLDDALAYSRRPQWLLLLRVDTVCVNDNGNNENLAPDSARELRKGLKGVMCLIGNFVG